MKRFNVADWLSIYRIVATPVIVVIIFLDKRELAGWLLLFSFLTDALDGYIARNYNMTTDRGANLDSVGDALTFCAGVVGLFYFASDFIFDHIVIISIALGLYLFQVLIAFIRYGRTSSFHTYSAKVAAILQAVFLVIFHIHGIETWLFWLAIAISILETLEEIAIIFVLPEWQTNVKGIFWVLKNRQKDKSDNRK